MFDPRFTLASCYAALAWVVYRTLSARLPGMGLVLRILISTTWGVWIPVIVIGGVIYFAYTIIDVLGFIESVVLFFVLLMLFGAFEAIH